MKVLVLNTWIRNIGNGFIDKGAKECIKRAAVNAQIVDVSGYPDRTGYYDDIGPLKQLLVGLGLKLQKKRRYYWARQQNTFNISEYIDGIDFAVLSGCILDWSLLAYRLTLIELTKRGVPIVFLGAGGADYSYTAQKHICKIIEEVKPIALLTRDVNAFDIYSKFFNYASNGIDCGFFISDWYEPPKSSKPFLAATFDSTNEPDFDTNVPILRADHEPFDFSDLRSTILQYVLNSHKSKGKQNMLISDNLKDYLFLYANATEVHSDRVHACVAALSYGNKTKLYSKTPRAALFRNILDLDITKELVAADIDRLVDAKLAQVNCLKEAIKYI